LRFEVPQKIRELKRQLRQAGFSCRPGKGSHTVWTHPALPRDELTISGSDGDDAKKYQELDVKNILKKLREVQGK
jgi:predicted RNA binding protein YcfA (HicA-like mRNA interferase family)